jgi:hypothetical protein
MKLLLCIITLVSLVLAGCSSGLPFMGGPCERGSIGALTVQPNCVTVYSVCPGPANLEIINNCKANFEVSDYTFGKTTSILVHYYGAAPRLDVNLSKSNDVCSFANLTFRPGDSSPTVKMNCKNLFIPNGSSIDIERAWGMSGQNGDESSKFIIIGNNLKITGEWK